MNNIEKINNNQPNALVTFASDFLDFFQGTHYEAYVKFINSVYLVFNQELLDGGKFYEKNNQIKADESLKDDIEESFLMVLGYSLQKKKGKASQEAFYKGYVNKLISDQRYNNTEVNGLIQNYRIYSDKLKNSEALNIDPNYKKSKKIIKQENRIKQKTLNLLTQNTDFLNNFQNVSYLLDVNSYPNGIETIQTQNIINGADFLGIINKITSDRFIINDRDLFILLHRRKKNLQGEQKYKNWRSDSTQGLTNIVCDKVFEINNGDIESYKSSEITANLVGLELEYLFLGDDGYIDLKQIYNFLSDIEYKKFIAPTLSETGEVHDLNKIEILEDINQVLGDFYNDSEFQNKLTIDGFTNCSFENNTKYKGNIILRNNYSVGFSKNGNIYDFTILNGILPIADITIDVQNNVIHEGESDKIKELKKILALYINNKYNPDQSRIEIDEDIQNFYIQKTAQQLYLFIQSIGKKQIKITNFVSQFRSYHRDEIASPEKPKEKTKLVFEKFKDTDFLECLFDTKIKKIPHIGSLSDKQELLFYFLDNSSFKSMLNLYHYTQDINILLNFHKEFNKYSQNSERLREYQIYENQKIIDKILDQSNHLFLKSLLQKQEELIFIFNNAPENIKESYISKISAKIQYVAPKMEDSSITTGNENLCNVFKFIELLHQIGMGSYAHRVVRGIDEAVDNHYSGSIEKITFLLQSILKNQKLILNVLSKIESTSTKYSLMHILKHKVIAKIKNHNKGNFLLQVFQEGIEISGRNKSTDQLNTLFNIKLDLITKLGKKINDYTVSSYDINEEVKVINQFLSNLDVSYIPNDTLAIFQNFIKTISNITTHTSSIQTNSITKGEGKDKIIYVQRGMQARFKALARRYDIDYIENTIKKYGEDLSKVPDTIFTKEDNQNLEKLENELIKINKLEKEQEDKEKENKVKKGKKAKKKINFHKINVENKVKSLVKRKNDQHKYHELLEVQLEMNQTFGKQEKINSMKTLMNRFERIVSFNQRKANKSEVQKLPKNLDNVLQSLYLSKEVLTRIKKYKHYNKAITSDDLSNIFIGSHQLVELFKGYDINQYILSILQVKVEKIIFSQQLDTLFGNLNELIGTLEYINGDDLEKMNKEKLISKFFLETTGKQTKIRILMFLIDKNITDDEVCNRFLDDILSSMDILDSNKFRNTYYYFVKKYRGRDDFIGEKIREKIKPHQSRIEYFDNLYR